MTNIGYSGGADALNEEQMLVARRLAAVHGRIRVARERSGIQLYMASPEALEKDGEVEYRKMHLSLNLDKAMKNPAKACAKCMKYETVYSLEDLLFNFKSLKKTEVNRAPAAHVHVEDLNSGPPEMPGTCEYLIDLQGEGKETHPLRYYMEYRGLYNIPRMHEQLRPAFCTVPNPKYDKSYPLCKGFRITPKGRVILFAMEDNEMVGWQARYLDIMVDDAKYILNPSTFEWTMVAAKNKLGALIPVEGMEKIEKLSRFYIPAGSRPSETMLGFDAAVRFNDRLRRKWVGIVEGPFDALRVGPPFCAVMGKRFNDSKAKKLYHEGIDLVVVVTDNDLKKGKDSNIGGVLLQETQRHCAPYQIRCVHAPLPKNAADLGEADEEEAVALINAVLKKNGVEQSGLLSSTPRTVTIN